MSFIKPISISLSPNTEKDDIRLAFKLLWQPWKWKDPSASTSAMSSVPNGSGQVADLENEFKRYLGAKYAISFNSGRSAFLSVLNALNLNKDDEILLQAFTCNAVPNPIIWSGFTPVYVDCDEKTFNIDIEDLKNTLRQGHSAELSRSPQGKKPKALVVQHTFGLPAEMDEILEICRQNNLILIEDCAHSLGATYKGKLVGTFGKAAFFSFSRDKVISSVYGGMVVTNDPSLAERIRQVQDKLSCPSYYWIFQQLLHPVLLNWLILPTYRIFGKYLLILFQWLKILSKAVHWKEKRGRKPGYFPKRFPNALAILALNQFKKLERFNQHRKEIARFYYNEIIKTCPEFVEGLPLNPQDKKNIYLRFAIKHPKAREIIKQAWQKNLLIGDWYTTPIAPHDTKLEKMKYKIGSCPKAEMLSKETMNLPTHINISENEARKIIKFLEKWK